MALTLVPIEGHEDRFHYVRELGRTDYGDTAEILGEVNAATVGKELSALGIEWTTWREKTWVCNVVAFVIDAYHPGTLPYLEELGDRLEAYPVLDEDKWCEAEHEAGICGYCGGAGLPNWYSNGDTCEVCDHKVGE